MAENSKFGPATWIPLGSGVAVFVSLLIAWNWLDDRLDTVDDRQVAQATEVRLELQGIKFQLVQLREDVTDKVTFDAVSGWIGLFEASNRDKGLVVPPFQRR